MSLLRRIRQYFYRRSLNHTVNREQHNHQTITFKQARTVGVLFYADKLGDTQQLQQYVKQLEQRGLKVQHLTFLNDKKQAEQLKQPHFTASQVNFFGVPKGEAVERFAQQPFDLLINLYLTDNQALEYISAVSAARYRVGRFVADKTWYCDLMVNLGEKRELPYLIRQIDHYLNYINSNAKAV